MNTNKAAWKRRETKREREPIPENMFESVIEDVQAIKSGRAAGRRHEIYVAAPVDVASVRAGTALTQEAFAAKYGFSLGAVRKWELGEREPDPAARTLLAMIRVDAKTVDRLLDAIRAA